MSWPPPHPLPLVLSVPHAGLEVPDPLAADCLLDPRQIAADGDVEAEETYLPLGVGVARLVSTPIARAVLDMNRPESDRTKDGVVKTHTCWDEEVWRGGGLGSEEAEWLLEAHHRPYHRQLTEAAAIPGIRFGIDAHTMAAIAPPVAPDPGQERPAACLSNAEGTCPLSWLEILAEALRARLGEVRINDPFRGGFITRRHATEMPWMQLELARGGPHGVEAKREAVALALVHLCEALGFDA